MRLLQNFTIRMVMLTILGLFVYSGRGLVYTASMHYPKFPKEIILTDILCGK
ncbi:methyl-accepting chemotaxis protein [Salmonella enterica subsp. arizonae]|uniref:Methyl-accepting chemotaxis protein n=1 Tax=Salmonella enterica subsp. arizonae TaxID=59203 RepID=A0A2X4T095_SALER|nr:methyl-accepting chemotaxis protein [Salmonella enterica subsp. arizonae]